MYIIFFASIIAIFLAWLESIGKLKHGLKYGFILMTFLSAIRYGYGTDYMGYIDDFKTCCRYNFNYLLDFNKDVYERGWLILMKLFEPLGVFTFFGFLSVVTNTIIYKFIIENVPKKLYWLSTFIYLLNFDFFVLYQSMIRQALAISLFILAFHFVKDIYREKEYDGTAVKHKFVKNIGSILKAVVTVTIMAVIHTSSLIVIPLLLIPFLPIKNGKVLAFVIILLFLIFWLSSTCLESIFVYLMQNEFVMHYGEKYATEEEMRISARLLLETIPPFALSLYFLIKEEDMGRKHLILVCLTSFLVIPFATIIQMISRLAYYFSVFSVASYPLIYYNVKKKYIRIPLLLLMMALTIYVWFDRIKNPTWGGAFLTYRTIFSL